jgi:hypothetical protein
LRFRSGRLVIIQRQGEGPTREVEFDLDLRVYAVPPRDDRVVIPFHDASVRVRVPIAHEAFVLNRVSMGPITWGARFEQSQSRTIASTTTEVFINGPGLMRVRAFLTVPSSAVVAGNPDIPAHVTLTLLPVDALVPAELALELPAAAPEGSQWCAWAVPGEEEYAGP